MSSYLLLGPVLFQDFELPERISWGGKQRLTVHRLPGGTRVIDALGRDDKEITWSGVFSGSGGSGRARTLDLMRADGSVWPLTWEAFFYSVVIASFDADYSRSNWIPYRITCTVLRDEAEALVLAVASLAADALSDLTAGRRFRRRRRSVGIAHLAVGRTRRDHARLRCLRHVARHARRRLGAARRFGGGAGDRVERRHTGYRGWPDAGGRRRRNARVAHRHARLRAAGVGQFAERQRSGTQPMQTLTTAGGNLFQIAAAQLGDATQWIRIAQLNNLSDPMLTGVVTLTIPAIDPNAGGGIATQ